MLFIVYWISVLRGIKCPWKKIQNVLSPLQFWRNKTIPRCSKMFLLNWILCQWFLSIFCLSFTQFWCMIMVIYHTNIIITKTRVFIMILNMCRKDLWNASWSNQEAATIEWIVAYEVCIDKVVFMKE